MFNKKLKSVFLVLLVLSLIAALLGCNDKSSQSEDSGDAVVSSGESDVSNDEPAENDDAEQVTDEKETIKIGVVVPLSGDMAWAGEAVKSIADYSVEELNATGGIDGKMVELLYEDDMGTSVESVKAVQKLIDIYDVDAIFGPMFTNNLIAIKDIVNDSNVVVIQPTSANPAVFEDNGYIFSIDVSPDVAIKAHCDYLYKDKGFTTIALFGEYSDQTLSMIEAYEKYWIEYGGTIVYSDTFNSSTSDFRTELTKIKALTPDVLWFTTTTDSAAIILRQSEELGYDESIWLASDSQIVSETFYDDNKAFLDGHFNYTQTGVPGDETTSAVYDALTEAFVASGGQITPVTYLVSDCFQILFEGMEGGTYSGNDLRESLLDINAYPGTTGYTTFNSDGSSDRSVLMVTFENGEQVEDIFQ